MNKMSNRRRAALIGLCCVVLHGCLTKRAEVVSEFPPEGFYLEVRTTVTNADGLQHTQRFQVWEDGMSVYREADDSLDVPGPEALRLPVFRRVSAYRMRSPSTRNLSRLLYRSGFFELQPFEGDAPEPRGKVISVHCREWIEKDVQASGQIYGQIARVLHVINSFLPGNVRFELPLMSGEREPNHLARVPEAEDSLELSLYFHMELVDMYPDDVELLLNAFALAYVQDQRELAAKVLERIEALPGSEEGSDRLLPEGTGADLADRLRRLF